MEGHHFFSVQIWAFLVPQSVRPLCRLPLSRRFPLPCFHSAPAPQPPSPRPQLPHLSRFSSFLCVCSLLLYKSVQFQALVCVNSGVRVICSVLICLTRPTVGARGRRNVNGYLYPSRDIVPNAVAAAAATSQSIHLSVRVSFTHSVALSFATLYKSVSLDLSDRRE